MCAYYIGGYSVDQGEGVQYIRDIMIHVGDVISTLGGYHNSFRGAN